MNHKFLLFNLIFISLVNTVFMLPIILLLMLFEKIYNYLEPNDISENTFLLKWTNSFLINISGSLKYLYNTKLHIKNNELIDELFNSDTSNSIIVQNHLSQFDFLSVALFLSHYNNIPSINMKMLSYYPLYLGLPGFGMVCYLINSIMITDNKQKNIKVIEDCKINKNDWLWFYPEGNVFCKKAKDINDTYCDKNKIDTMKNCMYPRLGGVEILQKQNKVNTIYSIGTQYDNIKPCDKYHTMINCDIPKNIYIDLNKHTVTKDTISNKTVEIFKDIDTLLDKKINENEYVTEEGNSTEILCMTFHILFFMLCCYMMYNHKSLFKYFIIVTVIYYIYLGLDMTILK